jgi:ketosteroid isomerase-like protein
MTDDAPTRLAAAFYEALAAGDNRRAAELLGPRVAFFEAPGKPFARADGPSRGGDEAVRRMLAPLGTRTTKPEIVTHELLGFGSAIVALGSFRSRAAGGEPGPTLPYAHIWVFDGAVPLEIRQYAAWLPLTGSRH